VCLLIPSDVIKNLQIVSKHPKKYLPNFLNPKILQSSPSLEIQGIPPGELLRVNYDIYIYFSGYRHLPNVDETECRAICLLEENCVAIQFTFRRGCKLFDTKGKFQVLTDNAKLSKTVVFLPRLQREKKNFILYQLKVKANQQRRNELKVSNNTQCASSCSKDAFCQAFVMCKPEQGSWCENAKGNCLLYSKQQITAVEKDMHSEMHFVWKNYTQVTET